MSFSTKVPAENMTFLPFFKAEDKILPKRISSSFSLAVSVIILISSSLFFSRVSISRSSIILVRSSLSRPLLEKTLASITIPSTPGGTFNEESFTSPAFSPNIALSSFSSGDSCVSPFGVILPTFIREGTPKGFKTISTLLPSSKYGKSSIGKILETTPLLPCLPAILSPTERTRFIATFTFINLRTPGGSSSPFSNLDT